MLFMCLNVVVTMCTTIRNVVTCAFGVINLVVTIAKMLPRFCVGCGLEIPEARLEAKPDATMCVKCATKNDKPYTATLSPDPDAPHPRGWQYLNEEVDSIVYGCVCPIIMHVWFK